MAIALSCAYATAVYELNQDLLVQQALWAFAMVCYVLAPEYVRSRCSQTLDKFLGNRTYPPASSILEVWSVHLQMRLAPPQSID